MHLFYDRCEYNGQMLDITPMSIQFFKRMQLNIDYILKEHYTY